MVLCQENGDLVRQSWCQWCTARQSLACRLEMSEGSLRKLCAVENKRATEGMSIAKGYATYGPFHIAHYGLAFEKDKFDFIGSGNLFRKMASS